jgi:3-hydroxyisobutyrate dehydrogenase-like beta-hydroxyacid dehydrogenase
MGSAPPAIRSQVLTGQYDSTVSSKRMQDDLGRVLDAARTGTVPTPFLSLLQAACISASHAPQATGGHLDVARWMADNAGVAFGTAPAKV